MVELRQDKPELRGPEKEKKKQARSREEEKEERKKEKGRVEGRVGERKRGRRGGRCFRNYSKQNQMQTSQDSAAQQFFAHMATWVERSMLSMGYFAM